jgi:hypothetical protein
MFASVIERSVIRLTMTQPGVDPGDVLMFFLGTSVGYFFPGWQEE